MQNSNSNSIGNLIAKRRKALGFTQKQLAEKLDISFQAVSKWENGTAMPGADILMKLSKELEVNVEDILSGEEKTSVSYSKAGVDISYTDSIKTEMENYVSVGDDRVLNRMGAFASLYDFDFVDMKLKRIIPDGFYAEIDLSMLKILPIFKFIRDIGKVQDNEMLSTFNCGVGLILIVKKKYVNTIKNHINEFVPCYQIGTVKSNENKSETKINFINQISWSL